MKNKIEIDFRNKPKKKFKKLFNYSERPEIREIIDNIDNEDIIEDEDIEDLQNEIDLKLKKLKDKIEQKKKSKKVESSSKISKKIDDNGNHRDNSRSTLTESYDSRIIEVPLKVNEAIHTKYCPECNKKLYKERVKHVDNIITQSFICKNKKCNYRREIIFRI